MQEVHIMEALTSAIDSKILEEWKHEGAIDSFDSKTINFRVDGKEYVLRLESAEICKTVSAGEVRRCPHEWEMVGTSQYADAYRCRICGELEQKSKNVYIGD